MLERIGLVGQTVKGIADAITAENIADADILTFFAGTNNYGHGSEPLGSITDDKSANSFYAHVKYAIDRILTLKPSVRLVMFTPLQRGAYSGESGAGSGGFDTPGAAGKTMLQVVKAIIDVCQMYGVPCYDLYSNSVVNRYTLSLYTVDNLHPNSYGGRRIGTQMGDFINTLAR